MTLKGRVIQDFQKYISKDFLGSLVQPYFDYVLDLDPFPGWKETWKKLNNLDNVTISMEMGYADFENPTRRCSLLCFAVNPIYIPIHKKDIPKNWIFFEDAITHYDKKINRLLCNIMDGVRSRCKKFFTKHFNILYKADPFHWSYMTYVKEKTKVEVEVEVPLKNSWQDGTYVREEMEVEMEVEVPLKNSWLYRIASLSDDLGFDLSLFEEIEADLPREAYLTSQYPYLRNLARKELGLK